MTKEQFFTFKSDMKKGMRIARLNKTHRKAYWNDGFATQEDQNEAIKKESEEIKSLENSIILKKPYRRWTVNGYVDDTISWVLGDECYHHWAYYIAKHRLDKDASLKYLFDMIANLTKKDWYHNPEQTYEQLIKPILEGYEKIVCTD